MINPCYKTVKATENYFSYRISYYTFCRSDNAYVGDNDTVTFKLCSDKADDWAITLHNGTVIGKN